MVGTKKLCIHYLPGATFCILINIFKCSRVSFRQLSYVEDKFAVMICHAMSAGDKSLMYDTATLFICDIMICVLSRLHLFTKESFNKNTEYLFSMTCDYGPEGASDVI